VPRQAAIRIFDLQVAFVEAAQFERAKEDVPDAIIDFLQSDVFAGAADAELTHS